MLIFCIHKFNKNKTANSSVWSGSSLKSWTSSGDHAGNKIYNICGSGSVEIFEFFCCLLKNLVKENSNLRAPLEGSVFPYRNESDCLALQV